MTVPEFTRQKQAGKKLIVVTAYDALFTRIVEAAGIEAILVGDSLGMVVQGKRDTLSVTMDDMVYHTRLVASAAQRALVIADLPFMSYQVSVEEAVRNAGRIQKQDAAVVLAHDRHPRSKVPAEDVVLRLRVWRQRPDR